MRKLLLLIVLIIFSVSVGYFMAESGLLGRGKRNIDQSSQKRAILRFAIVSDSGSENELLAKALSQAQGAGINFVIGLGDWSTVGTIDELLSAKRVFDESKLEYYVTVGDHDLWDSRNRGEDAVSNFNEIFGTSSHVIEKENIQIVILDNSDIYKGVKLEGLNRLKSFLETSSANNADLECQMSYVRCQKLTFVMAHKTPFHSESTHIMGEQSAEVADQAKTLLSTIEENNVDGFFSGDLHFFAKFKSPKEAVKITTIGAVSEDRNFQGPRFAIVDVYEDYTWEVEDVEIR